MSGDGRDRPADDSPPDPPTPGPVQNAELALLLEVAGTPKPGNVDRHRDLPELRFEQFLAGAVGAQAGLRPAADGAPVGAAFERAVAGMARSSGTNTQFGALLLLVPLVRAATDDGAGDDSLAPATARQVVEATTVADAADFYRAFEHVDVAVGDPPEGMADLDVRRGANAVPAVEGRGLTLLDVMALSADRDGVAAEWVGGFERSFEAGARIAADDGPVPDRAARAFLDLLAGDLDTLVVDQHGRETAEALRERARDLVAADDPVADRAAVERFADDLVARGVNPGTTADVVAAGLFVALERHGMEV